MGRDTGRIAGKVIAHLSYAFTPMNDRTTNLQKDALLAANIEPPCIYENRASGRRDDRSGLDAALAEFEREPISERTRAGLASARARGRKGGARYKMTVHKLCLAMAAMASPSTRMGDLCRELGICRQTLYQQLDLMVRYGRTGRGYSTAVSDVHQMACVCFLHESLPWSKIAPTRYVCLQGQLTYT